jgi:hypothetical protein
LSASNLSAQDNNNTGGQPRRGNGNGPGAGRNVDPAQWQQRMMDGIKDRLGFTNETEWSAVQPLVQKVMDARREANPMGFGRFGRRGGGDGGGDNAPRRGGFGGEPSPEAQALQSALEANAPAGQIKAAIEKYRESQKDKQAKLEQAQSSLRKVLSTKQEGEAVLMGLLN